MGNLSAYLRTKCHSSRNRYKLKLWFWCISILCFINVSCVCSEEVTPQIFPIEPLTLVYGQDPLEMYCSTGGHSSSNSSDLLFTVNKQKLPTIIVNETTIKLYIEKPKKQSLKYICRNLKTRLNEIRDVLVDSPPADVTDFKCVSYNLETLICTWTPPPTYSKINYSLTYAIQHQEYQCVLIKSQSQGLITWQTSWNQTSIPRYRQQEKFFNFVLNGTSFCGSHIQNITIDHFSVIKPNPPTNLQLYDIGTNDVTLKWIVPSILWDLGPGVHHRIVYQIAKIDSTDYFHEVNTSGLQHKPPGFKTSLETIPFIYTFKLPYAYMKYDIRIYIKSVVATKEEFWSNFTYIFVQTLGERPPRPPELVNGGFHQALYHTKRLINVYWKQVELYEEAGSNFTYRAVVEQGSQKTIMYPDKNRSMSYIVLDNASLGEIRVTVWSQNDNGSSVESSQLYIPPVDHTILGSGLTSFTKLAYENGTYELSWVNEDSLDNYTLFWCQYNATTICNGRLDYKVLDGRKRNHTIDLPKENRYQFAIAGNKGRNSSGMVWANKCEISREGLDMFQFPMELSNDAPGSTYVKLRWYMECALQHGIITGYKINYCARVKTSSLCDPTKGNQSIYIADAKIMEANITGLLPSLTYQFTIDLNTTKGLKTIINTTAAVTTLEDTPTKPRNVKITEIKNDSFVVSWDPPERRNGKIGKYVIHNFNQKLKEIKKLESGNSDVEQYTRQSSELHDLNPFTNYSITVQACNTAIDKCSETGPNDAVVVMTKIGRPGKLKAPVVQNNVVKWEKPYIPGGIIDLYEILVVKDNSKQEIINVTDMSYSITMCNNVDSVETYQVRAANLVEDDNHNYKKYFGEWSEPSTVTCNRTEGLTTIFIIIGVISMSALVYGSIKLSKWKLDRDDLKPPKFPDTLRIPEKDGPKFTSGYGGWSPANKDDKPSSDEMLLLPGNKITPDLKKNDSENCAVSDHTDSTTLSDSSKGPIDRQASLSNASSNSSLHSDQDLKDDESPTVEDEDNLDSNTGSSSETLPYLRVNEFKKNPATGYVQTVADTVKGYVQSGAPPKPQAPSTSYVMAGLSPPIFTTGVTPSAVTTNQKPSSGYVRAEDLQARPINLPKLGPSPTKVFGPESLPTLSPLPVPSKRDDGSYIQLQSLDSGLKPIRNALTMTPQRAGGYVSPGDAVLNKHLSNMLSPRLEDEPAMLDPTMSPDAYCRFSWNTDPASDNLHTLLTDSPTVNPSKH